MTFLKKLKRIIPLDLGQAALKHKSKGKLIAFSYIKRPLPGRTALDIGCRDGYWSKRLIAKGYAVKSIDIDPHYAPAEKVNVDEGLPFKDNSFDAIWCSEVIEHLTDPKKTIQDMIRISKNGGIIALTTPNSYFWIGRILCLFGLTPQKLQHPEDSTTHKHYFDLFSLKQILPKNSKVYGFFPYMIFKTQINKMVNLLTPTFTIIIKVRK